MRSLLANEAGDPSGETQPVPMQAVGLADSAIEPGTAPASTAAPRTGAGTPAVQPAPLRVNPRRASPPRRLVRRLGVWRGTAFFTLGSMTLAFVITGVGLTVAGIPQRMISYVIAFACSVTITPVVVAGLLSLIRQLDETEEELGRIARSDELTGLPNRRALIESAAAHAQDDQPIALLFIDVDHFKRVNDSHGHQNGDRILCRVTREIASQLREGDLLCRYGGEEFAVLLPATGHRTARALAERIRFHLEQNTRVLDDDVVLRITLSVGIACADRANQTGIYDLLDRADRAVYQAKHAGRNCTRSG